jgi:hypothetical protein
MRDPETEEFLASRPPHYSVRLSNFFATPSTFTRHPPAAPKPAKAEVARLRNEAPAERRLVTFSCFSLGFRRAIRY